MNKTNATIIIGILGFILLATADVSSKPLSGELTDKRITISMKHKSLYDIFKRLINDYDIAIGFEQSNLDDVNDYYIFETNIPYDNGTHLTSDGKPLVAIGSRRDVEDHLLTVEYQNAPLTEVMNDIVAQMKNYTWRIDHEVINIYPLKGREPKFAKLMDMKVGKYVIPKENQVGALQPFIAFQLPEFQTFLAENDMYAVNWQWANWSLERPLPDELSLPEGTFRELLNGITKFKRGGWILKRGDPKVYKPLSGENKECIHLIL